MQVGVSLADGTPGPFHAWTAVLAGRVPWARTPAPFGPIRRYCHLHAPPCVCTGRDTPSASPIRDSCSLPPMTALLPPHTQTRRRSSLPAARHPSGAESPARVLSRGVCVPRYMWQSSDTRHRRDISRHCQDVFLRTFPRHTVTHRDRWLEVCRDTRSVSRACIRPPSQEWAGEATGPGAPDSACQCMSGSQLDARRCWPATTGLEPTAFNTRADETPRAEGRGGGAVREVQRPMVWMKASVLSGAPIVAR